MAFNAGAVEGELNLNAKGFVDALKRAQTALDRIEKNTKKTSSAFTKFRNALSLLRDAMLVLPGLTRAVTAPFRAMVGFLKEASDSAAQFEVTVRKLSTALALAGNTGVGKITERVKTFADAVQETTGISNTFTLQVAQTLTVLGIQEKELEDSTRAVLEYSEATGRDAVEAARQFGKTLGGTLGELAEALPALKSVSVESLKAGGAFKFALQAFEGTAESVANTTFGLKRALESAFGDLTRSVGEAFNPVLNAILKGATDAVKGVTDIINANQSSITGAFERVAEFALNALEGISDFGLDFPVLLAQAEGFLRTIVARARVAILTLQLDARQSILLIRQDVETVLLALSNFPGLGALEEAAQSLNVNTKELAGSIKTSREEADALAAGITQVAKETDAAVTAAQAQAQAIRDGTQSAGAMAETYNVVRGAIDAARQGLADMDQTQQNLVKSTQSLQSSIEKRLTAARAINDAANATTGAIKSTDAAVRSAAAGAADLADNLGDAASAASDTASSFGGGSGRGGGEADAFGRSSGGSAGLVDLSSPTSAVASFDGLLDTFAQVRGGRGVRNSARATLNQVAGAVQGQIDQAFADFTTGILDELNRSGVTNAAARTSIIDERIAEAQRLGVLPSRRVALPFASGL